MDYTVTKQSVTHRKLTRTMMLRILHQQTKTQILTSLDITQL